MSTSPSGGFAGQHVVVIGGSSGVGLAVALRAESEGARITIMSRNLQRLQAAAAMLKCPTVRTIDLGNSAAVDQSLSDLGRIDHLVVSAGTLSLATIAQSAPSDWRAILEERIIGPLAAIKAAVPRISGSIVLFSGSVAHRPFPGGCLLAAAAAAIEGMTRELALELAPLRVNAVSPGLLDTPMTDSFLGAAKHQVFTETLSKLPVRRIGTSDDAADAATFLMKNHYVTGTIIGMDGGSRLI